MNNNGVSLPQCILEEIGFEGLDGITLEGLWKRISVRFKLPHPLNARVSNDIWAFVQRAQCLSFYELEEEREPFKFFDRAEYIDPFFGSIDASNCPFNFYKYNPISNQEVRGSCEHYETRKEISRETILQCTFQSIEETYGRRFVIVASQSLRSSLLIPPFISKEIDLNIAGYCILERLGRARYNGELASGKYSLADIGGDPTNFHNQKKKLQRNRLIRCQTFNQNVDGTNIAGQLIHLPRFFAQFKPRHMIIMEKIIGILKSKPNYMAEYQDVKSYFDDTLQSCLTRFFKTPFFHKFVLTDTKVPFRAVYPNALEKEWKLPRKDAERTLNVLQLRDPNIEPGKFWDKFEDAEEDSSVEDEDEGSFLDESHEVRDLPLLHQLYQHIKSSKEKGVSEAEASAYLGQSKLNGRALVRNLLKDSKIEFYTSSHKRQTIRRYVLPEFNKKHKQSITEIINSPPSTEEMTVTESIEEVPIVEITGIKLERRESDSCNNIIEANETLTYENKENVENNENIEYMEVIEDVENIETMGKAENHETSYDEHFLTERDAHKSRIDENIIVKITEIDETDHCLPKKRPLNDDMLTDKTKERLKFIQREMQSKILFDDPSKLLNALKQDESSRGLTDKMCRKTFFRLLSYLCKKGQLRLWRIEFQYQSKHRSLFYISNNTVDSNYSLMQSCIEQAKSRFQLNIFDEEHRKEGKKNKIIASKVELQEKDEKSEPTQRLTTSTNQSFNYGITPKFIRLRTLHEFLFYLAREHQSTEHTNQEEMINQWQLLCPLDLEDAEVLPPIWNAEMGWKMFIPPLIKHNGFDKGWCLLSDCIFRMPLSIFVKVVNITFEIKGLDEYISHPIKKHFLVKDIPLHLQQMLFARRKYIASLHDLIRRLICMGLMQAGPHRALKDQAFYYLNRYAALIDTSASQAGTYYISEQNYPEQLYKFDSVEDVYKYWDDMHRICMSTKLHRKPTQVDQTPADKVLPQKFSSYIKAIQPRQAKDRDIGELPGDHRGAAGLDSFFFAHLERNWAFKPVKLKQNPQIKIKSEASGVRYNRLVRMTRDVNLKKHESRITPVPLHKLKSAAIRRRVPIVRKKPSTVKKVRVRNKYDDIDRIALQHMNKLRVDWNAQEDNFLLLCKVAQMYLNPNNRFIMPGQIVRDLIHWHCKSLNKTTFACRRRIAYITKKLPNSDQINNSVLMCLNEIKANKTIQKRFGDNFMQNLKKVYPDEAEFDRALKVHFIDLVYTLSCQFYNLTNNFESSAPILPKTIQEFNAQFVERSDSVYDSNTIRYDEPHTVDDVKTATIVTLIHSTVCCCYDKTSWSIQLYEIYKDFPEKLLSLAMRRVRSDQLISQNKINSTHSKAQNRCLPLSSSGFHLSATYQQQMATKISYDIFDESYTTLQNILEDVNQKDRMHVLNLSHSAACFFLAELLHKNSYEIHIEMPKRVLLLDPAKRLPDESFDGIYARFHEIFNYIPKVDLGPDDSNADETISEVPSSEEKSTSQIDIETKTIINKLNNLPPETVHFFCIVNDYGVTKPRNQLELTEDGKCPFDCWANQEKPFDNIMDKLTAKREIWYRFNTEQLEFAPLPAVVTVDENNVVGIYNLLVFKGATVTDEQKNTNLDLFKQVSDIVDELLLENDKDFIDEDFGAEYDLRTDVKKKLYDGAQINDKIHKFHDFLCVNTCKLSLLPRQNNDENPNDMLDLNKLSKKRDEMLIQIAKNSNWSSELRSNKDFVSLMKDKGLNMTEIHIGIDIFNYIDSQGEMGAKAADLLERYEDKIFLQKVLDYLNESKLVMKTGVCEITYVHWKHIKPWVVNTYHLKRYNREAVMPTAKSLLQITDSPNTSTGLKRKIEDDSGDQIKLSKADESSTTAVPKRSKIENIGSAILANSPQTECLEKEQGQEQEPKLTAKQAKRLELMSIDHAAELNPESIPQTKKTFPLKMAPWIRVNGSVNRRVLDKYAGTILLHCIENVGLTLFTLCTRFHYLLPIHVHEIVQYLEEFECITKTAMAKQKPITLFSKYESVKTGPATDLDDFQDIAIEPTIDAFSKLSCFIGTKKYKEDFI